MDAEPQARAHAQAEMQEKTKIKKKLTALVNNTVSWLFACVKRKAWINVIFLFLWPAFCSLSRLAHCFLPASTYVLCYVLCCRIHTRILLDYQLFLLLYKLLFVWCSNEFANFNCSRFTLTSDFWWLLLL